MTRISNDDVRRLAREQYGPGAAKYGPIEIENNAEVSVSTDRVAYVRAWVEVDIDELTHPELHELRPRESLDIITKRWDEQRQEWREDTAEIAKAKGTGWPS